MENFAHSKESRSETDNEAQDEGERHFEHGGISNQKQIFNTNTDDSLEGTTKPVHDKAIGSDSHSGNEIKSLSQSPVSGSVFIKQLNKTGGCKHGKVATSRSSERPVHTTAQPCFSQLSSNEDSARRLHFISLALFEFSHQYKQLEMDTCETNEVLELTPCVSSLDTFRELCQKSNLERQRIREIVAKLLLDCNMGESSGVEFTQGVAEDSDSNKEIAFRNRTESSTGFEGVQVLREMKNCNVCGQPNIAVNIYNQTEDFSVCSADKNCVETQTESELAYGQTIYAVAHDLEDLQEKCKILEAKCNGFQEKVFEAESELCSAEVERDLKSEEARYLEEQVGSVRAMLSMRDNDLASLRKRYKFLNETFQNSEELRERLEKETSQMAESIRNLEEQLEAMKREKERSDNICDDNVNSSSGVKETYVLDKMCTMDDHLELSNKFERLVKQLSATNDALKTERAQKESVDKMMSNVEKERCLLLNELDTCKNTVHTQHEEMKKLRDQVHNLTRLRTRQTEPDKKQEKRFKHEEETNEKRIRFQSKEILELEKNISQQSSRVHILQEENKRLEDELYQQLDIIEKLGNENALLRKEEENSPSPGKNSLETVEEDIADDRSSLQTETKNQNQGVKEYRSVNASGEISSEVVHPTGLASVQHDTALSVKRYSICSCKLYSVPRSEYVKAAFELRALREEMKNLKEVAVPGAMKKFTVKNKVLKEQRTSLKNENKEVKKWLKTMKDNISAATVEDEMAAKHSIMLQQQLYEARILLKNKQHDLEISVCENSLISEENKRQKDAVDMLKQHVQQEKKTYTNTVNSYNKKFKQLEKQLQDETEGHAKVKAKLVVLEEQKGDVSGEFEKARLRLHVLQNEKEVAEKQLNEMKIKLINYFGSQNLEDVKDLWDSKTKECDEYVKVVEKDKRAISETHQELNSLTEVNTALRIELSEVKAQLQNEVHLNSQKGEESTCQKHEIDRLQMEIQTLGNRLEHEKEILQMNANDKKELKTLQEQMGAVQSELKQIKLSCSEKERECQAYMVVIKELQTTCKVYEDEFNKISIPSERKNASSPTDDKLLPDLDIKLNNISDDDRISENESDSSVENLQELQEMFQRNLRRMTRIPVEKQSELAEDSEIRLDAVILETQLHDAQFILNKKQHELNMIKIEKDILLSENKKQDEALRVIKETLMHEQNTSSKVIWDLKEKHHSLETQLKSNYEQLSVEKARIVSLGEHNSVLSDEFENLKSKFESLQKEKELISEQLIQIKFDIIKYFGNESLQSVSNSLNLTKKKCAEYNKIIDNSKSVISDNQRDMAELKYVNARLKIELGNVKGQMENKIQAHSEQTLSHKNEIGRLHQVINVLESDLEKTKDVLEEYSSNKDELERMKSEKIDFKCEISEVRFLLTEKERECESLRIIVQELETTCKAYEEQFEKSALNRDLVSPKIMLLDLDLEPIAESEEEVSPESYSDTTARNLQDFQETLRSGLSTKVKVLQTRIEELMNELTTYQHQNEILQQRLHSEEIKNLEIEAEIASRNRDEEVNKILEESSEIEKASENDSNLRLKESCEKESKDSTSNDDMLATLSHYKEIVARLREENTSYEGQLSKMVKETEKHKEKIAMLEYCLRKNCEKSDAQKSTLLDVKVVENNMDALDITGQDNKQVITHLPVFPSLRRTTANTREELECLMAKYTNLKAAFEGCRRKLRYLEGEEDMESSIQSKFDDLREKQVNLDPHGIDRRPIPQYCVQKSKDNPNETIDDMCKTMRDSCLSFSEMSVTFSENETDKNPQNGKDGMTVEVTLELETGLFKGGPSGKRITEHESLKSSDLRQRIEKLESLLLSSRNEIHRVKVCSFNYKLDFHTKLANTQGINEIMSKKLQCLEQEKKKQEALLVELEGKGHLSCHQEIERIKSCSLNERNCFQKAIMDLQNSNDAMKIKIDYLKHDKIKLNLSVESLTKKIMQLCDEIHRIKLCSFNKRSNLQEKNASEGQLKTRIVELEKKIVKCNDEIQRIKVSSLKQRENLKNNLQAKCKDLTEFKKTNETECILYKNAISDLEGNVKNLHDERLVLTHKMNLTNDELNAKFKSVVELKRQLTVKCQEFDIQVSENNHLLKNHQDTREEVQNLRQQSALFANERSTYKEEISNLQTNLSNWKQKAQMKDDELKLFESRLMEVQNSKEDSERLLYKLNEECKNSKDKNLAQEKEVTFLKTSLREFQKQKENTDRVLQETKGKVDNWKQKTKAQTEEIAAIRKSLAESQEEKEKSETIMKALKEDVENWKQEIQIEKNKATVLKKTISTLEMENQNAEISLKGIIEQHRQEKESIEEKLQTKVSEIITFKNNVEKLRQENIRFENDLKISNEQIFKQTENISQNTEKYQKEIDSWKQQCSAVEKKIKTLTTVIEQKMNENIISEGQIKALNVEKQEQRQNCEHIIGGLKQEINLSKTKLKSCEEEVTLLRHQFKEMQTAKEINENFLVEIKEKHKEENDSLQKYVLKYQNEVEVLIQELSAGKTKIEKLRVENKELLKEKELESHSTEQMALELKVKDNNYRDLVEKYDKEISTWVSKSHNLEKNTSGLREELEHERIWAKAEIAKISNEKCNEVSHLLERIENFKHVIDELKTEKENSEKIISKINKDKDDESNRYLEIIETLELENKSMKDEGSRNTNELFFLKNLVQQIRKEKENAEKRIAEIIDDKKNLLEVLEGEKQQTRVSDNARRNIENENNRLVSIVEELQKENEVLSQEKSRNANQISSLTDLVRELKEEGQNKEIHLQDMIQNQQRENELLRQNEIKNEEQLNTLHNLVEKNEHEKNVTEINIKTLNTTLENVCQEKRSVEEKLTLARNDNLNLQKSFEELESDGDKMKKQIEQFNLEMQLESKDVENLNSKLKTAESDVLLLRKRCKNMEEETTDLKSEIIDLKKQIEFDTMEKDHMKKGAERGRADLNSLYNEIEEVTKNKSNVEEELRFLQKAVEKESAVFAIEKEKHNQCIVNIQEIIDELLKGKQTLLEEIAMLSDKKKDLEMQNHELLKTTGVHEESAKLKEDNTKLELQISSLKVSLHTLQKAYEQSQDENKQNERRLQELRTEEKNDQDRDFFAENNSLKKQISLLKNKLNSSTTENRDLMLSIREKENRLLVLEKEYEKSEKANIILMERLKTHKGEIENPEESESGNSSTQMANLRKKLRELRSKLGEEKKQREIFEFEIKNLKDKVERLSKKEKEFEHQLEGNRKKILEMKTERDGLALDLESVMKRKKRDIEGYTSTIESLESELRSFKGKKDLSEGIRRKEEEFDALNEKNNMLEIKLMRTSERYIKENDELKRDLKLLQGRYDIELVRFRDTQTSNHDEVMELKKSLSTVERETENKTRELEKLRKDYFTVNNEKKHAQELLEEKSSEMKKWKKEAFDSKAEIDFLKGALNILEKEGLTNQVENSNPT